jgi:ubiquinone/menaquinone biosynthesis C-methylase UbiE
MDHGEFRHPRLVEVYDAECLWSREDEFFLSIVNEKPGSKVVDLGCGTGRLTLAMAAAGHTVTGVDPAGASLDAAKRKPGAETVTWVCGTCPVLPTAAFDTAVMTSHVAQFLTTGAAWKQTLADLRRSLLPGGRLVFDTRDPAARGWEHWNPDDSKRQVILPDGRAVSCWTEVTRVDGGLISLTHHYLYPDGHTLLATATMRFRTEEELRGSLAHAGFQIDRVYGGWEGQPPGQGDGEFLVIARRA